MVSLVLDAEALSSVARGKAAHVQAYLVAACDSGVDVMVPAAVLAELYRGRHQEQVIDSYLSRADRIRIVDTDRILARRIGHLAAAAGMGSEHHVAATVAAVAVTEGPSVVLTGDPDDLRRLTAQIDHVIVEAI
ncbi:PIN domain-containing protein [Nocardioides sp.]|uniref:PIN domain-containing protein n=1 Tax=Nocardioides sp. TaxID=35761 RepID=UPI0026252C41|nr:PIN domain-containing protein [Nocardioides sp.]